VVRHDGRAPVEAGGRLDDLLPPRDSRPNVLPPDDRYRSVTPKYCEGSDRASPSEAGAGLGDLLPPREARPSAQPPDDRYTNASSNRRRQRHGDDWNGVSLGDAFQAKPPARNRYGAPETEVASSARPVARQVDANGWGGASLGDALGPKKPARHRYGDVQVEDDKRSEPDAGAPRPTKPATDAHFDGASLGDVLRPSQQGSDQPGVSRVEVRNESAAAEFQSKPARMAQPDPWAGVSLGDAFRAPPKPEVDRAAARDSKSPRGGRSSGTSGGSSGCQMTPTEIIEWLKTVPVSHVPEQAREGIITCVESDHLDGDSFTKFVQKIDPSVCGPKPAMKLKAAWGNVLAEAAAREVCRQNLDLANGKKAVAINIAC